MVTVCPECDSPDITHNSQDARNGPAPTAFTCWECGHRFDEPVERTRKTDGYGLTGLSKQLDEMDPEDL